MRRSGGPRREVSWKKSPNPQSGGPHLQKRHYLVDILVLTIG